MHAAEREPGSRDRVGASGLESLQQASVAQQLKDLAAETTGLRDVAELRPALQHQRPHPGQPQFSGQHQAGWAGAHDDHIGVRHRSLLSQVLVASTCGPAADIVSAGSGKAGLGVG